MHALRYQPLIFDTPLRRVLFWLAAPPLLLVIVAIIAGACPLIVLCWGIDYVLRRLGWRWEQWERWPSSLRRGLAYLDIMYSAVLGIAGVAGTVIIMIWGTQRGYIVGAIFCFALGFGHLLSAYFDHRHFAKRWTIKGNCATCGRRMFAFESECTLCLRAQRFADPKVNHN